MASPRPPSTLPEVLLLLLLLLLLYQMYGSFRQRYVTVIQRLLRDLGSKCNPWRWSPAPRAFNPIHYCRSITRQLGATTGIACQSAARPPATSVYDPGRGLFDDEEHTIEELMARDATQCPVGSRGSRRRAHRPRHGEHPRYRGTFAPGLPSYPGRERGGPPQRAARARPRGAQRWEQTHTGGRRDDPQSRHSPRLWTARNDIPRPRASDVVPGRASGRSALRRSGRSRGPSCPGQ